METISIHRDDKLRTAEVSQRCETKANKLLSITFQGIIRIRLSDYNEPVIRITNKEETREIVVCIPNSKEIQYFSAFNFMASDKIDGVIKSEIGLDNLLSWLTSNENLVQDGLVVHSNDFKLFG
jgi:hypothetical protein